MATREDRDRQQGFVRGAYKQLKKIDQGGKGVIWCAKGPDEER